MAKRRAPKGGYAFDAKAEYRKRIWALFKEHCPIPRGLAQCLLMPSLEGLEIDVALAAGFREENLHIVDFNPAIVATLKRRYPLINTYGVTLSRACERIADNGIRIHCANFDLTSNLNTKSHIELQQVGRSLSRDAVASVTVLRGRETNFGKALKHTDVFERWWPHYGECQLLDSDLRRIGILSSLIQYQADKDLSIDVVDPAEMALAYMCASGIYKSGSQTMLWAVARLYSLAGRRSYINTKLRKVSARCQQLDNVMHKIWTDVGVSELVERGCSENHAKYIISKMLNGG
jgi:hypothetical protein